MGKVTLSFEIDADLVSQIEDAGVDPVEAARQGLHSAAERTRSADPWPKPSAPATAERLAADWAERNREALDEHRRLIKMRGSFADSARRW